MGKHYTLWKKEGKTHYLVAQSLKKGVVQITTSHVNKSGKQIYLVLTRCNQYCLGSWKTKNKQKKYTKKKAKGL